MRSPVGLRAGRVACWAVAVLAMGLPAAGAGKRTLLKDVAYAERESGPLLADFYIPAGDGPFPGVLVVHGGAWRSGNKDQLRFVAERLAASGYTVMAINYRLCPAHKHPAQIEDCKSAVRYFRRHAAEYKFDASWLGGWGYSAGAHLVSLLGTTVPSDGLEGPDAGSDAPSTRLQAVVAGGTPCDFRPFPTDNTMLVDWLGATAAEKPEVYAQASPIVYVTKDDAPMFLYHGDADELVPLENAQSMAQALEAAGVEVVMHVILKAKHIGAVLDTATMAAAVKFLDAHRDGAAATARAAAAPPVVAPAANFNFNTANPAAAQP